MIKITRFILISILFLTGCSITAERNAPPANLISKVSIPGVPAARFWADEWPHFSIQRLKSLNDREETQEITAFDIGGEHWFGASILDFVFSSSSAFTHNRKSGTRAAPRAAFNACPS